MVEPFISHRFPEYSAVFGDVDGDGRPDTVVTNSPWDAFVVLNRGEVHPFVSQLRHDSKEDLVAVNDQNGDGHGDFIYAHDSGGRRVAFGKGDGTIGDSVVTSVPLFISESFDVDFDGDGLIDAVSVGPAAIRLLKGAGDGTFVDAGTRPAPRPLDKRDPLFADFDGDGNLDIVTFSASSSTETHVKIYFGSPSFELAAGGTYLPFAIPVVAAADLEGDGTSEIIAIDGGELLILRTDANRTTRRTKTQVLPPDAQWVNAVGVMDFDGDGHRDLIASGGSSDVYIFRGKGDGTWHEPEIHVIGGSCLKILDLDGDGKDDVVSTCGGSSLGALYGGREHGGPRAFRTFEVPTEVATTDQNRDGITDLVVVSRQAGTIELQLGAGDGTFARVWSTKVNSPIGLQSSDLDGDGIPDLVVQSGETIRVLFGTGDAFTDAFLSLPGGAVAGTWNVDGKNVFIVRNGADLRSVAISPQHDVSNTVLPSLPAAGNTSLIQADDDPDFEILVRADSAARTHLLDREGDAWLLKHAFNTLSWKAVSSDLNADGRPDLVFWNEHFDMHLTDGASYRSVTFDFPTVALNGSMRWATITDFDRDGSNDVVLLNSNSLQVLRNLGNGTFAVSSVPSGGVEGGALIDADRDGWIDFIGRGLSSIHVVRNVCAVPRLKTVSPSAVHEEERATIYVQALGPTDLGGGVIEIAHNGAPVHEEVLLRFTATSWTSPPLAAGLHTFKIRYHTDPGFPIEEVEISVRAVAPGSRRRTVRH